MTKIEVLVATLGTVVCASLLAILFRAGWLDTSETSPTAHESVSVRSSSQTLPTKLPQNPRPEAAEPPSGPAEAKAILALVNGTDPVPDQALLRLAGMVNIGNASNAIPDKLAWQTALPVARKLLTLPCDCGQRNWLSHFIEMGDDAMSDSGDEYLRSAKLMRILGRNDAQEAEAATKFAGEQ